MTFNELKQKLLACKTKAELDAMRLPIVAHVNSGGTAEEFEKLQAIFKTKKNSIARSG